MKSKIIPNIRVRPEMYEALMATRRDDETLTDIVRGTLEAVYGDEALLAAIDAERGQDSVGVFIHDLLVAILIDDIYKERLADVRAVPLAGQLTRVDGRLRIVMYGGNGDEGGEG